MAFTPSGREQARQMLLPLDLELYPNQGIADMVEAPRDIIVDVQPLPSPSTP